MSINKENKSENSYKVHFKGGTCLFSSGSSESIRERSLKKDFDWISYHIGLGLKRLGKTTDDIVKIEYTIEYS